MSEQELNAVEVIPVPVEVDGVVDFGEPPDTSTVEMQIASRASGIAKLMKLGLTEEEALAIAGG